MLEFKTDGLVNYRAEAMMVGVRRNLLLSSCYTRIIEN